MFPTRGRPIERPNLKNLVRFLLVITVAFSISEGKIAYAKDFSLAEITEIHYQKSSSNGSTENEFDEMENTFIRIFAGIYSIQDDRFKDIYEGLGCIYGFGLSRKVYSSKQHNLFLSLDFKFYSKKGKSTVTEQETKLILKPISLSAVYLLVTKKIFPFAEIGLDYYPYKEESILHSTSGSAWGFHLQGGILITLAKLKSLKPKIYLRYSKVETTENDLTVNLGGIEFGIGFLYEFDLF
jgi:hypothetical protein